MLAAALSLLAVLVVGARAAYPRAFERRARRRRALGPDGIIVGAAPLDLPRKDAPGVLLLHGGGDTPQVLAGLARYLHGRGWSVRVPLLSGHGRNLSALSAVSSSEWHADVEREFESMRRQHQSVSIVGLSMGGALAVSLAARHSDITALVLLAPYLAMPQTVQRLAASSRLWGWILPYFTSAGGRSIHDPVAAAQGLGHGVLTPQVLRALLEVVSHAADALPDVGAPALVIQSREDNRISAADATAAFERLGSQDKQFVWVEGAGHVITVDYGRERVFDLTAKWLAERQLRA
jgi:carboxylesterase